MKVSGCHTHGNPLVYLNFNPRREEAVMLSKLPARRMQLVIRTSGVLVGTPDVSDIFGDMIMISRRLLAALSTVALMGAAAPSFAQEAAAPAAPAVSAPAAPAAEAPAAPSAESAAPAAPEAAKEEGTKKKGKKKHHHGKHHGKKSKKAASSDASSSDTSAQ